MSSREEICAAGKYLLSVLSVERAVPYSRFYSFEEGRDVEVANGIFQHLTDPDADDREALIEEGHLMVEWAAWQLQDFGALTKTTLETLLPDGEPDYLISITDRGRQVASGSIPFVFHSYGSGFYAREATDWLVNFAYHNDDVEEAFDFVAVREVGFQDGEVKVVDDGGNVYPPGSLPYEWAFEVSLWHLAKQGAIEVSSPIESQRKSWAAFLAKHPELFCHDEFLTDCPDLKYRLVRDPDKVSRVGWIGRE